MGKGKTEKAGRRQFIIANSCSRPRIVHCLRTAAAAEQHYLSTAASAAGLRQVARWSRSKILLRGVGRRGRFCSAHLQRACLHNVMAQHSAVAHKVAQCARSVGARAVLVVSQQRYKRWHSGPQNWVQAGIVEPCMHRGVRARGVRRTQQKKGKGMCRAMHKLQAWHAGQPCELNTCRVAQDMGTAPHIGMGQLHIFPAPWQNPAARLDLHCQSRNTQTCGPPGQGHGTGL